MDPQAAGNVIYIIVAVVWIGLLIWAISDAFTQHEIGCAGMGCIWPVLFIVIPPSLIFYLFMRFYQYRAPSRQALRERERERAGLPPAGRFGSDIDKLRILSAADRGHGTMYDPVRDHSAPPSGFKHFTDSRTEVLLKQQRYDEAVEYLLDLYEVATSNDDVRARDTYRHYLSLTPDGLERLQQQERRFCRPGRGAPPPPPRDVPF